MKVCACPPECPAPGIEGLDYDHARAMAREERHMADLKAWLVEAGYRGANTGRVVSFPVADGYARYMLAEGRSSCLVHLPYGDAYQYRDAAFLPKAEVLRRIAARERMRAAFATA